MEIRYEPSNSTTTKSGCLVIGIPEIGSEELLIKNIDSTCNDLIKKLLKNNDFKPKLGSTLVLHNINGIDAERLMLVGIGEPSQLNSRQISKLCNSLADALQKLPITSAKIDCDSFTNNKTNHEIFWERMGSSLEYSNYRYTETKTFDENSLGKLSEILVSSNEVVQAVQSGLVIGKGSNMARFLGDLPANICTPTFLANECEKLAKKIPNISVEILSEHDMNELGMNCFLSVSSGSKEPAKFIICQYHGAMNEDTDPIVLVGKGVTFDSGGINIKSAASSIHEMKYDMCGAASVFGCLQAAAELNLKLNIVGLIGATENMPSHQATKPGDVIKSLSGQTVEILNTDAEGRLVLCDVLTYARRFSPRCVVDIATLTGACLVALGNHNSGLMSTDDGLADELLASGESSGDKCWRLPIEDIYLEELDSNFADIANIGGRYGGTILAAGFLSRFTKDLKWAHLDIAGTAWRTGKNKGSTGRPVPLLMNWLLKLESESS